MLFYKGWTNSHGSTFQLSKLLKVIPCLLFSFQLQRCVPSVRRCRTALRNARLKTGLSTRKFVASPKHLLIRLPRKTPRNSSAHRTSWRLPGCALVCFIFRFTDATTERRRCVRSLWGTSGVTTAIIVCSRTIPTHKASAGEHKQTSHPPPP